MPVSRDLCSTIYKLLNRWQDCIFHFAVVASSSTGSGRGALRWSAVAVRGGRALAGIIGAATLVLEVHSRAHDAVLKHCELQPLSSDSKVTIARSVTTTASVSTGFSAKQLHRAGSCQRMPEQSMRRLNSVPMQLRDLLPEVRQPEWPRFPAGHVAA